MAMRRIRRFSKSAPRRCWRPFRPRLCLGIWWRTPNCTPRTMPPTSQSSVLSPGFRALSSWSRRGSPKHSRRTRGTTGLRQCAITASSYATTAWPNGGWSCQRESEAIDKQLFHLPATRYATPEAAQAALANLATSWRYHRVETAPLLEHKHYTRKGKPTPTAPITSIDWQIQAQVCPDQKGIEERKQQGACFVIGSNSEAKQLSDPEVITAYKAQAQAEGGCRFLKDPMFFVSSLFVKKPCRIQGLLMVMTLALLVYA